MKIWFTLWAEVDFSLCMHQGQANFEQNWPFSFFKWSSKFWPTYFFFLLFKTLSFYVHIVIKLLSIFHSIMSKPLKHVHICSIVNIFRFAFMVNIVLCLTVPLKRFCFVKIGDSSKSMFLTFFFLGFVNCFRQFYILRQF